MAFLRSFTDRRGRNPELAEKAITESKAFTEKEALDGKMIDLIVSSPDDLLRQLDGRTIKRFDGTQVPLVLKSPVRTPFALSARQKFLARIVQPDAFFVLLILGVLGLYTEFTHPGVIARSEEHTSELQSHSDLVCRLLMENKKHDHERRCRDQHSDSHPESG